MKTTNLIFCDSREDLIGWWYMPLRFDGSKFSGDEPFFFE
jgi:hypothetical protein